MVAVSARMIAQLAVADGYEVTALDRFGDVDLRAIAPGATASSNDALAELATGIDADAVVYGGGLENRADLVAQLSERRELLGTPAELLDAVRDPWSVAAAARAAGCKAPETRSIDDLPVRAGVDGWLRKPRHGGGGRGVRRWRGGRLRTTEILQRHIQGLSCSAVAIADGRDATVLGLTEQLHRPPGFGWTGNLTPPRLPEGEQAELERPAGGGVRRDRCTLRCARGIRSRRDLGWAPRLGARGQPAAAGRARAVRARQLRGPRAGGPWSRLARGRLAAGDAVCEGEARAVCPARPSGA